MAKKPKQPSLTDDALASHRAKKRENLRGFFDGLCEQFEGPQNDEIRVAAGGVWIGYPFLLEQIGFGIDKPSETYGAYSALNHAHALATEILMRFVEAAGLDSGVIWESSEICRRFYHDDPRRVYRRSGMGDYWPHCVPTRAEGLDESERATIRQSAAVIERAGVRLDPLPVPNGRAKKKRARRANEGADRAIIKLAMQEVGFDATVDNITRRAKSKGLRAATKFIKDTIRSLRKPKFSRSKKHGKH